MKQAKLLLFSFLLISTASVQAQLTTIAPATVLKSPGHYIGEKYGGGIVFFIYDKGEHGLIAALDDQSTGIQWYNGANRYTGSNGDGISAGLMNTAIIVATQMADNKTGNFAAKLCADYSVTIDGITYGGWYLPSKYELNLLFLQKAMIGGFMSTYFSSSEHGEFFAWSQDFDAGGQVQFPKTSNMRVRAIRTF